MNLCPWEASNFIFFSSNTPSLLYYSHIPAIIMSLLVGFLVFYSNKKSLIGKALLFMFYFFSIWAISDLILWATNDPRIVVFFWSLQILVEAGVFVSALYLVKIYTNDSILSRKVIIILSALILPLLIVIPTKYNISGVTLVDCYAVESNIIIFISYVVEIFLSLWIIKILFVYLKKTQDKRNEIILFILGISLFLLAFSFGNVIGSFTDNWLIAQYGLFGMPIFIGLLTYIMVKYQTFNIKLIATQALVWGLGILIGSQFFFIKVTTNFILNGVTFVGVIVFGYILVKSVKREVQQREQLQILTEELFTANEKLKGLDKLKSEFVSLASHQLRSPLTAIKGYTSMLLEGDYGDINPEAKDATNRIYESSQNLMKIVEDLLNVSKIEQGGMKYEMAPFDLNEVASDMTKDLSINANNKGLKLNFLSDGVKNCIVNGDKEKIRQVVLNFIDNSLKYTKEGEVNVKVEKVGDKVVFSVKDTGMGMTPEIKATLFHKFARGEGSRMNTGGSGLGLYLTKEIAEAHRGRVYVQSEGAGKGSTFYLELNSVK